VVVQAPLRVVRPVGFVVAGGLSTRMGRDKALLPWQGSTLLDHAIARLAAVCSDVRILCGSAPRYEDRGRRVVVDAIPDGGPLAGVAAGLESAGDAPGLYLGVDLPLVTVALLAALLEMEDADAAVPVTPGGPEPLCAVYRPGCRAAVRARLAAGDRKMTSFWPDVRVRTLEGSALAAFGDPRRIFRNVNAPADYRGLAGDAKEGA
jgi:molybdopterin-guanine dinucleotide biosynthesis protein A